MLKIQTFLAALFLLLSSWGLADVQLKMETFKSGTLEKTGRIYIAEDALRLDTELRPDGNNPQSSVIFRGDEETVYFVNHDEKSYIRMDREGAEKLSKQMTAAMKQMEEQLSQLPEAQRKMMEQMMKNKMPQAQAPLEVEVREAGADGDLDKFEIWVGGDKKSEVWVGSPQDVDLSAQDFAVFRKMVNFYNDLFLELSKSPFFRATGQETFTGLQKLEGFPVRIHDLEQNEETRISEAEEKDLPDSLFSPPADYKKRDLRQQ